MSRLARIAGVADNFKLGMLTQARDELAPSVLVVVDDYQPNWGFACIVHVHTVAQLHRRAHRPGGLFQMTIGIRRGKRALPALFLS